MQRSISGYGQDAHGDWFATLDCGHRQHVRHRPPFETRVWVVSEEGRAAHLGTKLECARCEAGELPADCERYQATPEFDEISCPAGLRREHTTRRGTWGRIEVRSGRLRYRCERLGIDTVLEPGTPGIVVPEVPHEVEPVGAVRFLVEFLRVPPADAP